jgi:uncharacterized membrane protein
MSRDEISEKLSIISKNMNIEKIYQNKDVGRRAIWQTAVELLFSCSPIFLLIILATINEKFSFPKLFGMSDWSLISAFLFGQGVVKLFRIPYNTSTENSPEVIIGLVAIMICFGLLPSAIFFSMAYSGGDKSLVFMIFQTVWFIISVIAYAWVAFISNVTAILKFETTQSIVVQFNKSESVENKKGKD